jgi:putative ABC transport system permease protein
MLLTNLKAFLKFLGRNKVYTAVTVAGFGVSLMFVVVLGLHVRGELSVDSFHEKKDRIYMVVTDNETNGRISAFGNPVGPWLAANYPDVESFVRVMAHEGEITIPGNDEIIDAKGLLADSIFFTTFSFPLIEGNPSHVLERRGSMVVSETFAGRLFGTDDPIGKSIRFASVDLEVTGVMADFPSNTLFPKPDFVADYTILDDLWGYEVIGNHDNSSWPLFVVEREGGDIRAHRESMVEGLKTESWVFEQGFYDNIDFVPLEEVYFGGIADFMLGMRRNSMTGVMLYLGIALLILVVALLNYVNMTVAQAGFRGKEVALKKLHGAGRGMIVSQLLVESLVVTLISFATGVMLTFATEPFFDRALGTTLGLSSAFTLPVVLAMVGLIVVLALISGIVPAMLMSRFKPIEIIKGSFSRRVKGVYSRVLAVFQYAVSIALLICSALIVMQSRYLATRDVGLDRDGVMLIGNIEQDVNRQKTVASLLADIPGVEAVSRVGRNPFNSWGGNWSFDYNGEPQSFETFDVDSTFFRLFGVTFEPTGADPHAGNVIYLNRPGYNALKADQTGNVVNINTNNTFTVVGILSDFNFRPLKEAQGSMMLQVHDNLSAGVIAVKIAAGGDFIATSERVAREYANFVGTDRFEWEWADDTVYEFYEAERRTSRIMGAFTVLVMLIMFMGIFAMSIYVLRQKEKEIAIRKINGSTIGEILALLGRQSLVSVAIAFVVAVPVAWWAMSHWLESFPYRIDLKWWVFVAAGMAVILLLFVCVGWQSYRAATANPVNSLKSE